MSNELIDNFDETWDVDEKHKGQFMIWSNIRKIVQGLRAAIAWINENAETVELIKRAQTAGKLDELLKVIKGEDL